MMCLVTLVSLEIAADTDSLPLPSASLTLIFLPEYMAHARLTNTFVIIKSRQLYFFQPHFHALFIVVISVICLCESNLRMLTILYRNLLLDFVKQIE